MCDLRSPKCWSNHSLQKDRDDEGDGAFFPWELELISLEERRLKRSYQCLKQQRKPKFFTLAKRQWAQAETQKVPSQPKKSLSCSEGDQRVAQILQGVGSVSILGDTQNLGGQGPQQSALAGSAWARGSYSVILTFFRNTPVNLLALLVLLSADGMGASVEVTFLPWSWFLGSFPWDKYLNLDPGSSYALINYQRRYSINASNATDVLVPKHTQNMSGR